MQLIFKNMFSPFYLFSSYLFSSILPGIIFGPKISPLPFFPLPLISSLQELPQEVLDFCDEDEMTAL